MKVYYLERILMQKSGEIRLGEECYDSLESLGAAVIAWAPHSADERIRIRTVDHRIHATQSIPKSSESDRKSSLQETEFLPAYHAPAWFVTAIEAAGWVDHSWHNDAGPCWLHGFNPDGRRPYSQIIYLSKHGEYEHHIDADVVQWALLDGDDNVIQHGEFSPEDFVKCML